MVVLALPGCITYGDSFDEDVEMAKDAIQLYLEELKERGESIPEESQSLDYSLNLSVA